MRPFTAAGPQHGHPFDEFFGQFLVAAQPFRLVGPLHLADGPVDSDFVEIFICVDGADGVAQGSEQEHLAEVLPMGFLRVVKVTLQIFPTQSCQLGQQRPFHRGPFVGGLAFEIRVQRRDAHAVLLLPPIHPGPVGLVGMGRLVRIARFQPAIADHFRDIVIFQGLHATL